MAIPGMPGKRLDSLQPELTGTASTVARRFGFDSNKRWLIVAALAVPAVVGVGLIGLTMSAKARQGDAAAASASAEPPPDPVTVATPATSVEVTPAGPATSVVTTGNGQASPENELPNPAPAGTLIGVSPTAPKSKPAAYVAKPAAQPSPAPNPYPAKKPPPTSGTARPALPPGLPLTRQ
jgi:hypothetical protein